MTVYRISAKYIFLIFFFSFIVLYADIQSSHQDFSGSDWANGEICLPCHTPHNANMEVPDSPLWNHQVTSAAFEPYASSTMNAFPGQPDGKSKLCLSCHDGTVTIENHSGNTNGTRYTDAGKIGTDLRNQHPISFTYNFSLAAADGELYDPETTLSGLGGTIQEDLLEANKLQCTSCHDVHISRNTQGCSGCHDMHGQVYLETLSLWKSNAESALCFTCHNK